jgi:hypothetical protein
MRHSAPERHEIRQALLALDNCLAAVKTAEQCRPDEVAHVFALVRSDEFAQETRRLLGEETWASLEALSRTLTSVQVCEVVLARIDALAAPSRIGLDIRSSATAGAESADRFAELLARVLVQQALRQLEPAGEAIAAAGS